MNRPIVLGTLVFLSVVAAPRSGLQGQDGANALGGNRRSLGMELANPVHAEVELGEFVVPVRISDSNSTITVFTRLFATVRINELDNFEMELEARQARIREKIIMSLRGASREDLYERNLTTVKQRLLEAASSAIESPKVYRVGFLSFYYNED